MINSTTIKQGYFLVKSIKEYENIYFVELEDIKSTKIEDNFLEKYLQTLFNRAEEDYSYGTKNINRAILLGDNTRIRKDLKEKSYFVVPKLFASFYDVFIDSRELLPYSLFHRVFGSRICHPHCAFFFSSFVHMPFGFMFIWQTR